MTNNFSTSNKSVPFTYIASAGENFQAWFGSMKVGKGKQLGSRKLSRAMNDKEIFAELKPKPCTLGDLYETLKTLNKDTCGIFYVKDRDGVLRAVSVDWDGLGWNVNARSVTSPGEWLVGLQVFSRNFSDAKNSDASLDGKEISIDGKTYVLKEKR